MALAVAALLFPPPAPGWTQAAPPPAQPPPATGEQLTQADLDQLVGRIALYPDDLLAVVLPASTLPLQLVEAQRYLDRHKTDASLKPSATWDPSVVALLNYPDVLSMMNDDLDWTQQLGDAVVAQQTDVLNAIQAFRKKVYDAGNLKSNDKQSVKLEDQTVLVQSADPQIIYVPQYIPEVVVAPLAVGAPAPYVYSPPYPYYASPAATFATGAVFGAAVGFAIGWTSHGIYSGNGGWGGYYGSNGNINVNRTNNINVNNARLTDAQRTQFNSRITQNRENAWRPDRTATARQQASLATRNQASRVNPADIRSGLAGQPGAAAGSRSPHARQNAQQQAANRGGGQPGAGISNRTPGTTAANRPSPGGGSPARQPGAGLGNRAPGTAAANRPSLLGHARLENTAFYTKVATRTIRTVISPLDKLGMFKLGEIAPAG